MSAKTSGKETIYVDVDEEITGIVDKIRSSDSAIQALVLPRRATMFQSAVNMKLLKRAADQDDKKIVLISSEPTVLSLAGATGIHVAQNLNSKPYLPTHGEEAAPKAASGAEENGTFDPSTPIGDLSGENTANPPVEEAIQIDNTPKESAGEAAKAAAISGAKKPKKSSKLKVPDFKKFRTLMIVGGIALVLLIVGVIWAFTVAPKATITLRGETKDASVAFDFVADTEAKNYDEEKGIIPALQKELKKTDSEKAPATGQKDKGNKASGTMSLKNCTKSDAPVSIPSGTAVSSGDLTFVTQGATSLEASEFTGGGNCKSNAKDVAVIAQAGGDKYNLSPRSYSVAGAGGVVANGSQMTGGTSQIVKVISAGDIEAAKQKLVAKQASINDEVRKSLEQEGYIGLSETFVAGTPKYTPSAAVDSEANEVTLTSDGTYNMLGVKEDDLKKLIKKKASGEVDTEKQSILSYGLNGAAFQIGAKRAAKTNINLQTKIVAGPDIDEDGIKQEVGGKKKGEAEQILSGQPGIKEARVETKPFWNSKVPKKASKVTITIEEADGSEITE